MKKHNFNPGPSILPQYTIEQTAAAIKDFAGTGLSILEVSHRSKEFEAVNAEAIALFKELLGVPDGYHVIFVGGGASTQFVYVPYNLLEKKAAYLLTGEWATRAYKEAKCFGQVDVVASSEDKNFTYIPKNFTRTYHGPTRFAVALASSYNVSAVHVAHTIGIEVFYDFLKNIGFGSLERGPSFYGLGLVLGNADISLFELAQAYTIFPKEGLFQPVRMLSSIVLKNGKRITITNTAPKRVLSRETTFLISHILSDLRYKIPAFGTASPIYFPFPVAVKTGTTKDFRDNCVVGYTPLHTIAIWVGNLYNEPMKELPAVAGAGLLLRNTELFLWNSGYPFPPFVASNMTLITQRVCALSGMIAHEGCSTTLDEIFTPDNTPSLTCDWHNKKGETTVPDLYQEWAASHNIKTTDTSFAIIFPTRDAVFGIDRSMPLENQCIPLEVRGGDETTTWYDNGTLIGKGKHLFYQLSPGEHILVAEWKTIRDQVRILVIDE